MHRPKNIKKCHPIDTQPQHKQMHTMIRRLSSISMTSNAGQETEQYLPQIEVSRLTHAESIIAALQQEVRSKDNKITNQDRKITHQNSKIARFEEKIMQMSIENAILKAQQDEHQLMTRRMMNDSITKPALQDDEHHNLITTQKMLTESTHGLSDDEYSYSNSPIPSKNQVRRNAISHIQQHCEEQQQVPLQQSLASEVNHVPAKVPPRKNGRPIHRPCSYVEPEECTEERSHPRDSSPLGARIAPNPTQATQKDVVPTNVPPPTQEKNWTTRRQSLLDAVTSEEPSNIGRRLSNFGLALMGFTKNGSETSLEQPYKTKNISCSQLTAENAILKAQQDVEKEEEEPAQHQYPKPDYIHNSPPSIHSLMQKRRSSLESLISTVVFPRSFQDVLASCQ